MVIDRQFAFWPYSIFLNFAFLALADKPSVLFKGSSANGK